MQVFQANLKQIFIFFLGPQGRKWWVRASGNLKELRGSIWACCLKLTRTNISSRGGLLYWSVFNLRMNLSFMFPSKVVLFSKLFLNSSKHCEAWIISIKLITPYLGGKLIQNNFWPNFPCKPGCDVQEKWSNLFINTDN